MWSVGASGRAGTRGPLDRTTTGRAGGIRPLGSPCSGRRTRSALASVHLPEAREIRFESCPLRLKGGLPPLFHPSLRWAARGGRILVSSTARYVVDVHEGGRQVVSVRRDLPLRPVTEENHVVIHRIEEEG